MKLMYSPCIGYSATSKEEAINALINEVKKRREDHEEVDAALVQSEEGGDRPYKLLQEKLAQY